MPTRKVKVDGEEFEVELEKSEGVWEVTVEGVTFTIEVEGGSGADSGQNRSRGSKKRKKSGTISSSIPGKVVSLHTEVGATVEEGDVVMILEAMKMQNEIQAPLNGTVVEINCQAGDSVEANMPLIVIEPVESDED